MGTSGERGAKGESCSSASKFARGGRYVNYMSVVAHDVAVVDR